MSLSIIIPARNEEVNILKTLNFLILFLKKKINYQIIIIDDFSIDKTYEKIKKLKRKNILIYKNIKPGVGNAISTGILKSKNKYVCFFMADLSDSPKDLLKKYYLIKESKADAIFGSRFIKGSLVFNYPKFKLFLNRLANNLIKFLYNSNYNDFTNAFKLYKRSKLNALRPFESSSFNIFLEIPLKFIERKFLYIIIPISWRNRSYGKSNFKINELTFAYLKILFKYFFKRF
jgi:dolichol-phosphate mannosyltransferase